MYSNYFNNRNDSRNYNNIYDLKNNSKPKMNSYQPQKIRPIDSKKYSPYEDYEGQINDLKNNFNGFQTFQQNLNKEIGIYKQTIEDEKILKNYENEIQAKKQILEKYNKEIGKYEQMNEYKKNYENEIKKKQQIIDKVSRENAKYEQIKEYKRSLEEYEYEIEKKKEMLEKINKDISNKENLLNKKNNVIQFNYDKTNRINGYDIIVDIKSFKPLLKNGWKIIFPNKKKIYEKNKNKKTIIVGVVGNGNKGKSFILQKLSNYEIPEGFAIKTEGLSIKFSETETKNIAILDSAGQETPLLEMKDGEYIEDPVSDEEDQIEKIGNDNNIQIDNNQIDNNNNNNNNNNDGSSNNNNNNNNNNDDGSSNNNNNDNKNENKGINEEIEEYARDKLLSENFLQKFIIDKSNVLLVVVGNMTLSEQKLLTRIKSQANQQIIVIHNLQNFTLIEQVKKYIKNTLLKLKMISLERNVYQEMSEDNKKEIIEDNEQNKFYFVENEEKIIHLIFANEYSKAGKYYNKSTIKYLKKKIDSIDNRRVFNVIDDIQKFFIETSNDILEENIRENEIYFDEESNSIKLKDNINSITLKKYLIDELGFTLQKNGFFPKYSQYLKDDKLIFKIEFPGSGTIKPEMRIGKGEYIFIFKGEKYMDKELNDDKTKSIKKKLKLEYSNRESGSFTLEIKIPQNLIQVRNSHKPPRLYKEKNEKNELNGIVVFEYEVDYIDDIKQNSMEFEI